MSTVKEIYHVPTLDITPQNQSALIFINDFPFFKLNFDSYLDNIAFPITNLFFPYDAISTPFQSALFEYLTQDWKAFEEKLASFSQLDQKSEVNFLNTSYEDLLNMPVDEGAEGTTAITQQPASSKVDSQGKDLFISSSFENNSGSADAFYRHHLNHTFFSTGQSPNSLFSNSSPLKIGDMNYIINTTQETQSFSSSFRFVVNDNFAALALAANLGDLKSLLFLTSHVNGERIFLGGVSDSPFGPFFLINADSNPLTLLNGQITLVNNNGNFSFLIIDPTPTAESFFFEVRDSNGHIGIGNANISEIQDQFYDAAVIYDSSNNILSFSATGNLLENSAAAKNATLSILSIDITNSGNTDNDIFSPIDFATTYTISGEQGATTTFTINPDWSFSLTSIVNDINNPGSFPSPLTISYVVGDGLGNTALASATFTPNIVPIVLDINDNGIHLISAKDSSVTLGSITGTNNDMHVGWIGEGNAMLMYDPNGTGKISNLNQISFVSYTKGAQTDLEGLQAFDTNNNHLLDIHDNDYHQFGIIFTDGNFETLSQAGIVSIGLLSDHQSHLLNGNTVYGLSTYQTTDGHTHLAADVGLGLHASSVTTLALNDVFSDTNQLNLSTLDNANSSLPAPTPVISNDVQAATTVVLGLMQSQDVAQTNELLTQSIQQLAA